MKIDGQRRRATLMNNRYRSTAARKWTTLAYGRRRSDSSVGAIGFYFLRPSFLHPANATQKNTLIKLTSGPLQDAYPTFTRDGLIRFARFSISTRSPLTS
jgi:hypothetical protein